MAIDERLEALAQSVAGLGHAQRETEERIRHLAVIAEQNEVRAGQMMETMNRLGRILDHDKRIDDHGRRLDKLEP